MNVITIESQCGIEYPVHNHIDACFLWMQKLRVEFIQGMLLPEKNIQIAIWCRGSSGLILATMLVNLLRGLGYFNLVICFVRKDDVQSHGTNSSYKTKASSFHVIIDDFICTGSTILAIEKVFLSHMRKKHFLESPIFDLGLFSGSILPNKIKVATCINTDEDEQEAQDDKVALFNFDYMKGVEF